MPRRRLLTESQAQFSNEGQTVTGTFLKIEDVPYHDKFIKKYTFDSGVGTMIVMGSLKIDEAMEKAEIGEIIELTYLGTQRTAQGFDVKLFEIAVLTEEDHDEPK